MGVGLQHIFLGDTIQLTMYTPPKNVENTQNKKKTHKQKLIEMKKDRQI